MPRRLLPAAAMLWAIACGNVLGLDTLVYDAPLGDGGLLPGNDGGPVRIGALELSAPAIDFGVLPCGAPAPAPRPFSLTNRSAAPVEWTVLLSATTRFSLRGPTSGTLAPGGTQTLEVSTLAAIASDLAGESDQSTLTVRTSDPQRPSFGVPVQMTAGGGTLAVVPGEVGFGVVPNGTVSPEVPLDLRNDGNLPLQVRFEQPLDTSFTLLETASSLLDYDVPAGTTLAGPQGRFTPRAVGDRATTARVIVQGTTCGAPLGQVSLTGTGGDSDVGVTPSIVDFGNVPCGSAGTERTARLTNTSPESRDFSVALAKGDASLFTVTPATGTIQRGQTAELRFSSRAVPTTGGVGASLYADTAAVTVKGGDLASPKTFSLSVRINPTGVVLAVTPGAIDFGSVRTSNDSEDRFLTITSSGTLATTVNVNVFGPDAFRVRQTSPFVRVGTPFSVAVVCNPRSTGEKTGRIELTTAAARCKPYPAPVELSCRGTN